MLFFRRCLAALAACTTALGALAAPAIGQYDWQSGGGNNETYRIRFCNNFHRDVSIALNYLPVDAKSDEFWTHEGWFVLAPGVCRTLRETSRSYYYYYAESLNAAGNVIWGGSDETMCVKPHDAFLIGHMNFGPCGPNITEKEGRMVNASGPDPVVTLTR